MTGGGSMLDHIGIGVSDYAKSRQFYIHVLAALDIDPGTPGGRRQWDALLADGRFRYADEPEGLENHFRLLTSALAHQPKRWQDACLAAFAVAADMELVTLDAGFRSFPGLRHHILSPPA